MFVRYVIQVVIGRPRDHRDYIFPFISCSCDLLCITIYSIFELSSFWIATLFPCLFPSISYIPLAPLVVQERWEFHTTTRMWSAFKIHSLLKLSRSHSWTNGSPNKRFITISLNVTRCTHFLPTTQFSPPRTHVIFVLWRRPIFAINAWTKASAR